MGKNEGFLLFHEFSDGNRATERLGDKSREIHSTVVARNCPICFMILYNFVNIKFFSDTKDGEIICAASCQHDVQFSREARFREAQSFNLLTLVDRGGIELKTLSGRKIRHQSVHDQRMSHPCYFVPVHAERCRYVVIDILYAYHFSFSRVTL